MQVLQQLPQFQHPDLLVGNATADDAGVWRLNSEQALVLTVDVLTPVVNDPYLFGQIAAANSLSDVYAMGGKPVAALCLLGYPVGEIKNETVRSMLAGVWDKVREAGAVVVGGHTTKDMELKCGLAVTGVVHPDRIVTNAGVQSGDRLILTKPLGIGIITTALKGNLVRQSVVERACRVMTELNRTAAEIMVDIGVHAATDITGFGLLGHAWEMAQASRVDLVFDASKVPFIEGALALARQNLFPGGSQKNYEFIKTRAVFHPSVPTKVRRLLCDAQTSGGLLIAVSARRTEKLLSRLHRAGISQATEVGWAEVGTGVVRVS